MSDDVYLEPSHRARVVLLWILSVWVLLFAGLWVLVDYVTPRQDAPLEELTLGGERLILLLLGMYVILFIAGALCAVYVARLAYRTFKFGIFPPPGTIVVRRTRVRTGKAASLAGWVCIFPGFLSLVFLIGVLSLALWVTVSAL